MKTRSKKTKTSRRTSPLRKMRSVRTVDKEPTLLERIADVTEQLQALRSRLANNGGKLPAVGTHRIASLETELEKLWELRRQEQAAPLRESSLSEEEEKILAFPSAGRSRGA